MQETLDNLIIKGKSFTFEENSNRESHGIYTKASSDLLSWITMIENFVLNNYEENSAIYNLYQSFDKEKLNGYEETDFDKEIETLFGVLKACKSIPPNKKKYKDENKIISLIKNTNFWTVLVFATGSAFTLGLYVGSTKFDKEKIDYERENFSLKKSNDSLQVIFDKISENNQSLHNNLRLYEKDNAYNKIIQSRTKLLEECISKAKLMDSKYDMRKYENWKEEVIIILDKIDINNYEIKAKKYFIDKIKECEENDSYVSPKQYECAIETIQRIILMTK